MEQQKEPILIEKGEYEIISPENGELSMDTLVLKSTSGAKRIWKLKTLDQKQAIFEIKKFG